MKHEIGLMRALFTGYLQSQYMIYGDIKLSELLDKLYTELNQKDDANAS